MPAKRDRPFRLVLNGGVLRHPSGFLEQLIRERVEEMAPAVETVHIPLQPVGGEILLALDLGGLRNGPSVVERLLVTLPGRELFARS